MNYFHQILSHPLLLKNIEELEFFETTDIQREAIPHVLKGHDVFGIAQTGTGKTASFCLPLIERVLNSKRVEGASVLIMAPTRELCLQINDSLIKFMKGSELKSTAIYGGVKQIYQTEEINRGVNFIVATPGRLLDLLSKDLIKLDDVEVLVLDEADRMLEMGLVEDLNQILKLLPKRTQTLLYSATVPEKVHNLSQAIQNDPIFLEVTKNFSIGENISHSVIHCAPPEKLNVLKKIIIDKAYGSVLIFTNTKNGADDVCQYLNKNQIEAKSIHSDKKQTEREKCVKQFSEGRINVLVATDLASRGIDIETISMVINFDIPTSPEVYVHRAGRTGRAERTGAVFSLCTKDEIKNLQAIEALISRKLDL